MMKHIIRMRSRHPEETHHAELPLLKFYRLYHTQQNIEYHTCLLDVCHKPGPTEAGELVSVGLLMFATVHCFCLRTQKHAHERHIFCT